jgi:hypothetical protein
MSVPKYIMLAIIVSILTISTFPAISIAETDNFNINDTSAEAVVADVLLLRPLGLVATILGAGIYVISLPFSIPLDQEDEVAEKLVGYPAHYTFTREIGNVGKDL